MNGHRKSAQTSWHRRQDPPTAEQVEAWANAKVKTTEAEAEAQRVTRAAERDSRREEREERRAEKQRARDDRRKRRDERGEAFRTWGQKAGQRVVLVVPILLVNVMALAGQSGFAAEHLDWKFPMTWVFAGAVESIAIYIGWHAHVALLAGHSVAKLRAASYGVAAVVAAMNFEHFANPKTGDPTASSFAFGMMSLLSPWLWAMHSRYVHREQLEKDGLVDARAARFSGAKWLHFPFRTWGALRWSIDQGITDPAAAWSGYALARLRRSAAKRDRSGKSGALPETAPGTLRHVAARVPVLPHLAARPAAGTRPMAALSPRYMLNVPHPPILPPREKAADQDEVSGTPAAAPAPPTGTRAAAPARVPERAGTDRHADTPAAPDSGNVPDADTVPAATLPEDTGTRAAPESDPAAGPADPPRVPPPLPLTVPLTVPDVEPVDPADVLRAKGATVPTAAERAEMTQNDLRDAARTAWRELADAGHVVSGEMLGKAFGRSERWGREQVSECRKYQEAVIRLMTGTERQA